MVHLTFNYFVKNLNKISTGIFEEEKYIKRLVNKINCRIELIDKLHTPNTHLREIDTKEGLFVLLIFQKRNYSKNILHIVQPMKQLL